MTTEVKESLKKLLAGGKNCNQSENYKTFFQTITGKRRYGGRCSSCECSFLYQFLTNYLKNNK